MDTTREILNTEGCSLLLYDKESDSLIFKVVKGDKGENLSDLKVPRGKGIAGYVLETLESIIVNDAKNDPRIYRNIDEKAGFQTKNLICVPMIAQGEIQGVLEAVNSIDRQLFEEKDIQLLKYLSDLAAIAIRNRILIDELKSRVSELDCLFQISQALSSISDLDKFLELAVKTISEVLSVNRVSIVFKDPNSDFYKVSNSSGFSLDEDSAIISSSSNIITKVLKTGEPILVENTEQSEFNYSRPEIYQTKSFLSVPIKNDTEVIGVLSVADKKSKQAFDLMDLRVVTTISNQISDAYNALLVKEQNEKLEAIDRDMQIASEIQKYSLPNIPKKIGELEIETFYEASKEIGGDFYDLIYHNPEEVSIIIADVSGKGIPAALFMEFSKTIIAQETARCTSTSQSLANTNYLVRERSGYFMFVTLMLIRINSKTKKLLYSSAGHNRQLLYKSKEKKVEFLSGKGTPLGIGESVFSEHTVNYSTGDLILLYTDGITETENESGDLFGEERLVNLIESNGDLPIGELKKLIRSTTQNFQGKAEVHDDYTFLLMRL